MTQETHKLGEYRTSKTTVKSFSWIMHNLASFADRELEFDYSVYSVSVCVQYFGIDASRVLGYKNDK